MSPQTMGPLIGIGVALIVTQSIAMLYIRARRILAGGTNSHVEVAA